MPPVNFEDSVKLLCIRLLQSFVTNGGGSVSFYTLVQWADGRWEPDGLDHFEYSAESQQFTIQSESGEEPSILEIQGAIEYVESYGRVDIIQHSAGTLRVNEERTGVALES